MGPKGPFAYVTRPPQARKRADDHERVPSFKREWLPQYSYRTPRRRYSAQRIPQIV